MPTVLTHLLYVLWKCAKCFWVCCRLFFLQSRSVVLDCGHTPGQHAQCLNTPATHIQHFIFFLGQCCWFPNICFFYPGGPELWLHMINWPVPFSIISSYTVTSLTVPSVLYSSMMYVPWSTLIHFAFSLYHLHNCVLTPWHVSSTAWFLQKRHLWDSSPRGETPSA